MHTDRKPQPFRVHEAEVVRVELGKVRVIVNRDELKNEEPKKQTEPIDGSIDMPVEDVILRLLHRMIGEG